MKANNSLPDAHHPVFILLATLKKWARVLLLLNIFISPVTEGINLPQQRGASQAARYKSHVWTPMHEPTLIKWNKRETIWVTYRTRLIPLQYLSKRAHALRIKWLSNSSRLIKLIHENTVSLLRRHAPKPRSSVHVWARGSNWRMSSHPNMTSTGTYSHITEPKSIIQQ